MTGKEAKNDVDHIGVLFQSPRPRPVAGGADAAAAADAADAVCGGRDDHGAAGDDQRSDVAQGPQRPVAFGPLTRAVQKCGREGGLLGWTEDYEGFWNNLNS